MYILCRLYIKINGDKMLKFDKAFDLMKEKGLTTYKIRKEKIIGENALTAMRNNQNINSINIDRLCKALDCQPGDLMEYVSDESENN